MVPNAGDVTPENWSIPDESLGYGKETQTCKKDRSTRRSRSSRSCAGWRAARRGKPSASASRTIVPRAPAIGTIYFLYQSIERKRPPECLQRRLDLDVSVRATTPSSA
jgi:hypothetical protein